MLSCGQFIDLFLEMRLSVEARKAMMAELSLDELARWNDVTTKIQQWGKDWHEWMDSSRRLEEMYRSWQSQRLLLFEEEFGELEGHCKEIADLEHVAIENFKQKKVELDRLLVSFNKKEKEQIKKYHWPVFSKALWLGLKFSSQFRKKCFSAVGEYEEAIIQKKNMSIKKFRVLHERALAWSTFHPSCLGDCKVDFLKYKQVHREDFISVCQQGEAILIFIRPLLMSNVLQAHYQLCTNKINSRERIKNVRNGWFLGWTVEFKDLLTLVNESTSKNST